MHACMQLARLHPVVLAGSGANASLDSMVHALLRRAVCAETVYHLSIMHHMLLS